MKKHNERFGSLGDWEKIDEVTDLIVKLSGVKSLGNLNFEINYKENGISKSLIMVETRHWIEDSENYISAMTSENADFYALWVNPNFRKDVCNAINRIQLKNIELQAA